MTSHELAPGQNGSQDIDTPIDTRMEVALDQGVFNEYMAAGEADYLSSRPYDSVTVDFKRRPHYSRRGGRSYPEASDSELDPNWNSRQEPLTPQQVSINKAGAMLVRQALESAGDDIRKLSGDDAKIDLAIRRARQERRER